MRPSLFRSAAAALFLSLAPLLAAQERDAIVDRMIALERDDPQVHARLAYLCERIGARLTGSTALQRACEWTHAELARMGLDARLERWGELAVGFERGRATGGIVAPVPVPWEFGTPAWSAGTPGPVRGRALLYPRSEQELEEHAERYRGAWVVDLPRAERPAAAVRRALDERLEGLAIAGRVRDSGPLIVTGGRPPESFDALPRGVRVNLRDDFFADLSGRLARGEEVEVELDVDNRFTPGPIPLYNVIAELRGSELPDEYVIVGGHIDSWDGAQGAQDNGTGVATTLEAARLLAEAGARPRRTIRFMLWSGEEQGLLGSRAYVEAHPDELARVSAVLVHDGGTNYVSGIASTPAMIDDLRAVFAPAMELSSSMPFEVTEVRGLPAGVGSDHDAYLSKGVPGFFWRQEGRSSYRRVHHTQHDTIETVVPEYQQHSATVIAIGAWNLANLDHLLDRTELVDPTRGGRRRGMRLMGVQLEDTEVTEVTEEGMAERAHWQPGDVILAIDGVDVTSRREVVEELQKGGPRKVVKLQRGDQVIESVLDYTGTPSEIERERARAEEAAAAEVPSDGSGTAREAPAAGGR